ncbi:hypothetical protein [Pseudomonas putida]|uniref:hypothetical protein n=1 Tax=Pseudomonas putida TaxID=303 RepID=UPI000E1C2988|nr:hypothetical protein [Pseudomonas putida]
MTSRCSPTAAWAVDGNLYIIEIVRGKWDAGDLEAEALRVWERWKPWDQFRPAALRYMRR